MAAYSSSLLGGYLSDSILGKYKTILYVSLIYVLGSTVLAVTAIPGVTTVGDQETHWWGVAVGLGLVALGTGGIKPVVSTFVGDQFGPSQAHLLPTIFHMFYFCINLGAFASMLMNPIIRTQLSYSVAFGLPAFLLLVATLIFFLGRNKYSMRPPTGSVVYTSLDMIRLGIAGRCRTFLSRFSNSVAYHPTATWLDPALKKYPKQMVDDLRAALSVLTVFIPIPLFWALYDQSASRWIFQARNMDRHIWGYELESDQIPAISPLLVLLFVPLFDRGIYKLLAKCGCPPRPLQRMAIGMVFTAVSFGCAAVVQFYLDQGPLSIVWQLPQWVILCCGEIMVSVTGLEMAYTQSPKSMKSLIMAMWLLTVAIGNFLVVLVVELAKLPQWQEFVFFSGLMMVGFFLFLLIAWRYEYRLEENDKDDDDKDQPKNSEFDPLVAKDIVASSSESSSSSTPAGGDGDGESDAIMSSAV
eukprot:TRINITY_DN2801_c0_g1_i4.p1 TRINITY_DN2801_c0_g1~~TRINITY_DN2801_c0_g1_i4.p1  ORF type:complete len:543 (+),score=109.88 TRINITY_DN2801_c0_g1_i4:222-1631(+)